MRQAATGESMPPERSASTRPLEPTGSPPAPGTFSSEKKARPGRMSTATVSAAASRSTVAPVAAWIMRPSTVFTSGEVSAKRLSLRLVRTRKLGSATPSRRATIAAPRRASSAAASPARVASACSCASAKLATPKTRARRSRTAGQAARSASPRRSRAEAQRTRPTGSPAVARSTFSTRRRTKKGRLRPLSAIS